MVPNGGHPDGDDSIPIKFNLWHVRSIGSAIHKHENLRKGMGLYGTFFRIYLGVLHTTYQVGNGEFMDESILPQLHI